MESNAFKSMSTDKLWSLHEQVTSILAHKIVAPSSKDVCAGLNTLIPRLGLIGRAVPIRRFFRNTRTQKIAPRPWSGRGKQPHWVRAQLRAGKKLEHFLIARPSIERRHILKMARTSA